MKKKHTSFITAFLKANGSQELVDKWLSSDVQEKWNKMYVTKGEKKRCTCYILFCLDKREGLKTLHPEKSPAEITSLLASNWRQHKEKDDEVYQYYKKLDHRQVFCKQAREKISEKYSHLPGEEIDVLVEMMYSKAC